MYLSLKNKRKNIFFCMKTGTQWWSILWQMADGSTVLPHSAAFECTYITSLMIFSLPGTVFQFWHILKTFITVTQLIFMYSGHSTQEQWFIFALREHKVWIFYVSPRILTEVCMVFPSCPHKWWDGESLHTIHDHLFTTFNTTYLQ
jgi:hypothetical protein